MKHDEETINEAEIHAKRAFHSKIETRRAFLAGAEYKQKEVDELVNFLFYLKGNNDGVGICLGYQADIMLESLIKKYQK